MALVGTHTFDNGRGASVIDHGYGADRGLLEIAVLDAQGYIDYSTPITDDVIGWLTEEAAQQILDRIAALPA